MRDGESDWHADYDGLGRRISFGRSEKRTQLYWDGDRIAGEIDHHGRVRVYLYLDETALIPVAFTDYESEHASPESGRTHHVFHDATGMPHHIESASGQVVWRAVEIDAYGSITVDPKATIDYHLRWPGHRFDEDTGLHYNRYRDYDPKLGRYIEPDPLGHAGGINLYAYSKNPMVDVDLLGLYTACRLLAFLDRLEREGRPMMESEPSRRLAAQLDTIVAGHADAKHRGDDDAMRARQGEWQHMLSSMGCADGAHEPGKPADLVRDVRGVYGFVPTASSQFHTSKDWPDWTDPTAVASARERRLAYLDELNGKRREIQDMRDSGYDDTSIARHIVEARNEGRIASYVENGDHVGLQRMYERNTAEYGRREGPTFEQLRDSRGKTAQEMIESATRSNATMDIVTGILVPR